MAATTLLLVAVALAFLARSPRLAVVVVLVAIALFALGYAAYLTRHLRFERRVRAAEAALASADLERARAILAPLLERYPQLAMVQRAAGRTLYALGDPLSAASLLEKAARSFRDDAPVAATLVASYAALNRGGDARRAAALLPKHVDVRLALAWSELVALGGDRGAGGTMVADLRDRADVRDDLPRRAMAAVLGAVAAAHRRDVPAADAALREVAGLRDRLAPYERAFIGYLEGVALRELAREQGAVSAWSSAMEAAAGTIGEALARRELANLAARPPSLSEGPPPHSTPGPQPSGSSSSQPSSD